MNDILFVVISNVTKLNTDDGISAKNL